MKKSVYISKAEAIHGKKYKYDLLSEEINLKSKIWVICDVHGPVQITAGNHISKQASGCKDCGRERANSKIRDTFDEFLEKERKVHGDKYEPIESTFTATKNVLKIKCKKCGKIFEQTGTMHLAGNGCSFCNPPHVKLTTEDFKRKLSITHPNLEVLSEYISTNKPITVRCKIHDYTYTTTPHRLVQGSNCQKCYDERRGKTLLKNANEVMNNIKKVHGDNYSYPYFYNEYKNSRSEITAICEKGHVFKTSVNKHLAGHGCEKCASEINGERKRLSIEEVLERCNNMHKGKYKYPFLKEEYKGWNSEITVICNIHDKFTQKAGIHMSGCGCPCCNESHLERTVSILFPQLKRWQSPYWLGRQNFDFFLNEKNIAIECQGGQHFTPSNGFGGEENFKITLERDLRKFKLAKENNVKIIYITNKKFKIYLKEEKFQGIYDLNVYFIEDLEKDTSVLKDLLK